MKGYLPMEKVHHKTPVFVTYAYEDMFESKPMPNSSSFLDDPTVKQNLPNFFATRRKNVKNKLFILSIVLLFFFSIKTL